MYLQKMVYGRGIYMSDNPSFCKTYGNSLILSRVLRPIDPGYGRVVSKNWCNVLSFRILDKFYPTVSSIFKDGMIFKCCYIPSFVCTMQM